MINVRKQNVPGSWMPRIMDAVLPDERVVWSGRPAIFRVTVQAVGKLIIGTLFVTVGPFIIILSFLHLLFGPPATLFDWVGSLGLSFVYLGFVLVMAYGIWRDWRRVYVVTERRAVVLEWRGGRYVIWDELRPEGLGRLRRRDRELGVGDLVFGVHVVPRRTWVKPTTRRGPYGFLGVRRVDEAELALRSALTPLYVAAVDRGAEQVGSPR